MKTGEVPSHLLTGDACSAVRRTMGSCGSGEEPIIDGGERLVVQDFLSGGNDSTNVATTRSE